MPWLDFTLHNIDENLGAINVAYLFKPNMSGFYLTFRALFYQEIEKKHGKYLLIYLKNKSRHIREFLEESNKLRDDFLFNMDFSEDTAVLKKHSAGTIVAKYYDASNVPSDEELINDLNYFLDLYAFVIDNYENKTDLSVDEWVKVLENKELIDDKMFSILEIMNEMDNYSATTSQISKKREELGFLDEKSYNSIIISNSIKIKEFLNKKPIYNDDGSENYWTRFFYGKNVDGAFEFKMKDELVEAFKKVNVEKRKKGGEEVTKNYNSFYDFLLDNGYLFDKGTIENYLLSLKVKPFAILTGNSGTGKTKLSQLFSQYISNNNPILVSEMNRLSKDTEDFVDVQVTTEKSSFSIYNQGKEKNPGWTISNEFFSDYLPLDQFSGEYKIEVDGIEGNAIINPVIQVYYDKDSEALKREFEKLYLLEKESIEKDKENKVSHEIQLVGLELNVNSLENMVNTNFTKFKGDISFKKEITTTSIKPGEFIVPYEIFDYIPFNKNQMDCKIISCGRFSNANIHIKFKLRKLSKNIREYLEEKGVGSEIDVKIKNIDTSLERFNPDWSSAKRYSSEQIAQLNEKNINLIDFNSQNYKIIPVGANWTENRNIVGYYNVITNKYQSTPAYDLIKQAQESDEPHFLILDEMNLSHVERYFADFLSAIESKEKIPLYGEEALEIPDNLFIIGTVNVDETTYMFSPKVLDRANVLEFKTYSAASYMNGDIKLSCPDGNLSYLENPLDGNNIRSKGIDELRELFDGVKVENKPFWNILSSEIEKFQSVLKVSGFDFGFRVINEIVRFMAVAWEYENRPDEFSNWERYFDAQIKQKMLPKLHGSEKIIGDTIDDLHKICLDSSIDDEAMAKYPESYKKLTEMRKVLRKQRYVSFIN